MPGQFGILVNRPAFSRRAFALAPRANRSSPRTRLSRHTFAGAAEAGPVAPAGALVERGHCRSEFCRIVKLATQFFLRILFMDSLESQVVIGVIGRRDGGAAEGATGDGRKGSIPPRLDQIIDLDHALVRLAKAIGFGRLLPKACIRDTTADPEDAAIYRPGATKPSKEAPLPGQPSPHQQQVR
jgi:hypothetical protein